MGMSNCETCVHNKVCGYKELFYRVKDQTEAIEDDIKCGAIHINVVCDHCAYSNPNMKHREFVRERDEDVSFEASKMFPRKEVTVTPEDAAYGTYVGHF